MGNHQPAAESAGRFAIDEAQVVGRRLLVGDDAALGLFMRCVACQVKYAGLAPEAADLFCNAGGFEVAQVSARGEVAGAGNLCQHVVVACRERAQHAGPVAGGALAGAGIGVDDRDLPAAGGEAVGRGGSGQSCPEDDRVLAGSCNETGGMPVSIGGGGRISGHVTAQHVALAMESGRLFDAPAVGCQRTVHAAGGGPGGECRAWRGECREGGK